jgi:hypothetical protein
MEIINYNVAITHIQENIMLKPSSFKNSQNDETAELIAQFKAAGGVIQIVDENVALGLNRKKYIKKAEKVVDLNQKET